jgi:uncharacterized protein (TIGR02246 family)
MRFHRRVALLAGLVIAAAAAISATAVGHGPEHGDGGSAGHRACARQFDETVQRYVSTTQARDVRGFASVLDRRVVLVFRPGDVLYGKRETMAFIRDFFADPSWTQTFRVITTTVDDCRTAFVLFDSVYSAPGSDPLPLVIGVSFTYHGGRWLAVHNQDSQGPANPPNPPQDSR